MRRSVSSCVSPGPLVPMPPLCWRHRCVHAPVSRGIMYCSCATSTIRRLSAVMACFAKMSRIRPVRSSTLIPGRRCSRFLTWEPERSSSNTTILACCSSRARLTSFTLPSPISVAGLKFCTRCKKLCTTSAPAVSASLPSSASCSPASHGRTLGVEIPTRMQRSFSGLCSVICFIKKLLVVSA